MPASVAAPALLAPPQRQPEDSRHGTRLAVKSFVVAAALAAGSQVGFAAFDAVCDFLTSLFNSE